MAARADASLAERGITLHLAETIGHPSPRIQEFGPSVGRKILPGLGNAVKGVAESVIVLLLTLVPGC